jgi:hypothetical protein
MAQGLRDDDDQSLRLGEAQLNATGDMPAAELRAALHEAADLVADYLEGVEEYAVLPSIQPGAVTERLGVESIRSSGSSRTTSPRSMAASDGRSSGSSARSSGHASLVRRRYSTT